MLVYGMAGEIRRTGTVSLLQTSVSDEQRGRVMSTQFLLQRVAGGIGIGLIGYAADHHGVRAPLLAAAVLAAFAWAFAYSRRQRIVAAFR